MLNFLKNLRIGKNEIIADIIFLLVSMMISAMAIFVFDIHWSFYPGQTIIPPSRYILTSPTLFYIGIPIGGIVGFVMLKLIAYAFIKEEDEHLEGNGRNKQIKKTKKEKRSR